MASLEEIARGDAEGEDNSLDSVAKESDPETHYGKAFVSGFTHGATAGHFGTEYEPQTTGERVAKGAGDIAGMAVPFMAFGPAGRIGAGLLGAGESLAARGALEMAGYGAVEKLPEGKSRLENIAEQGIMGGAVGGFFGGAKKLGKAAFDYVGSLTDVSEDTVSKVMDLAKKYNMSPEEIKSVIDGGTFGPGVNETAEGIFKNTPAQREFGFARGMGEVPVPSDLGGEALPGASNLEFQGAFQFPKSPKGMPRTPEEFAKAKDFEANSVPAEKDAAAVEKTIGGPIAPPPESGMTASMLAGIHRPEDLAGIRPAPLEPQFPFPKYSEPGFEPTGKELPDVELAGFEKQQKGEIKEYFRRGKFSEGNKYQPRWKRQLVESNFITPESELTPTGAQHAGLFQFFPPRNLNQKFQAAMSPIPDPNSPNFSLLPPAVRNFVQHEVHGPVGAVSDAFGRGEDYFTALDQGVQTAARGGRHELSAEDLKGPGMEAVVGQAKLAMDRAGEILSTLDPNMSATDLSIKAGIPENDAGAIMDELGASVRAATKESTLLPKNYKTVPPEVNAVGDEIVSDETLHRALMATEISPEQFRNAGHQRPDGTVTTHGRSLLNNINVEWNVPLTEKVIDIPPTPRRPKSGGGFYEAFDINSPEGRLGLASVRAGGMGDIALKRGTIEGLLPMSVEEGMARKRPLVRVVPGGYQFTQFGAAVAATHPSGIVRKIDIAANRQFDRILSETGEISFEGGRGGVSYEGLTEEQVKKANLDYETTKEIVVEHREAAAQYGGCPKPKKEG